MVSAIAFCPSPPLLVPELAAGAAAELDPLRAACREAVRRLLAAGPDEVVVIGTGPQTSRFPPGSTGTLAGYGVPVTATLPGGSQAPGVAVLPLALTVGAWLLAEAGASGPCSGVAVAPDADPARVGLTDAPAYLVVGDGSACRSVQAPGYVDHRAEPFDAAVQAALAAGDPDGLRDLEPGLGARLLAAGVPAWRVVGHALAGRRYTADLLYAAAPYGVGYLVASWAAG